jgi:hypothetical protein
MKFLFSVLISLFTFNTVAQISNVVVGSEYINNRKEAFNGFVGETDLALFAVDYAFVSKKKQELLVRKYDKNDLSLIESVNILSNPLVDFNTTPLELFFVNKNFYLFSEMEHVKENHSRIGLFIYDESCQLLSFEVIDTVTHMSKTEIEVKMASDTSGFIVAQSHVHKVANRQVVELSSIDLNGKVIWRKELLSTNSVNQTEVEQIIHTKNETYLLCNYGYKGAANTTSLSNKYTLWVYNHELNFMKEVVLRLKRKWINGVKIKLNNDRNLVVAGYVNDSKNFGINACFNFKLNNKYEPQRVNYTKISAEDLSKFSTSKKVSKINYIEDMYLRDVILQKDGSFYTIGEEYFIYVDRVYDPRTNITSTTEHYNYNALLISYFDLNGNLKWNKRVTKSQNSVEDFGVYSSFSTVNLKNNTIAIIYNDSERNLALSVNDHENHRELFNNRRHAIVYVLIDETGIVKRNRVVEKTNFNVYAKQSKAIKDGQIYLRTEYGRHSKVVGVSFE